MKSICIEAPARICLFGDHQDYLGLPVIACAINRYIRLHAVPNTSSFFNIQMPDIKAQRQILIDEPFQSLESKDFFGSALRVVRRYGCNPNQGFDIIIKSNIPINAGVSSSSALVVAWIQFLLETFGCDHEIVPQFIAELAYEAEVLEHNAPGGRMDMYTIAIGEILYIDTSKNLSFESIENPFNELILVESGVPKDTIQLLSNVKTKVSKALDIVTSRYPDFNIAYVSIEDYDQLSLVLPEQLKPYFYAAIKNHEITQKAHVEFKKEGPNLESLGLLMTAHNNILKDLLKVTVPKVDHLINIALEAGALGAKIVGSGGGGSIVVIAPSNKSKLIINTLLKAGAKKAYPVKVAKGSKRI
ncbi:mevalonate kinase [Geojedonia litorea]|uniref:Mevalonate kinase n=1 Tax=Geojedonia litorea TaxID=1268269 RepID=A0ABV9MZT4_9FLAO